MNNLRLFVSLRAKENSKMTKRYNVLDLFCGCGGLFLGFEMAGFDVKLAIDNWEDALVTYRKKHKGTKTLNADLLNLNRGIVRSPRRFYRGW